MQALILAGGEGTRLRPLTSTVPKPVVPLANRPFITYMLDWLARHGVRRRRDVVRLPRRRRARVLGDGRRATASDPLRRGARAARHRRARSSSPSRLLDERFAVLNGDILTDLDLSARCAHSTRSAARGDARAIPVEDPSAYGAGRDRRRRPGRGVPREAAARAVDTDLINAGTYVLEREVLDHIAAGPRGVVRARGLPARSSATGLYGSRCEGYWLDIGTPERYLQATRDILAARSRRGRRASTALAAVDAAGARRAPAASSTPAPRSART